MKFIISGKSVLIQQDGLLTLIIPFAISIFLSLFALSFHFHRFQQIKNSVQNHNKITLESLSDKLYLTLGSRYHCRINFNGETFPANGRIERTSLAISDPDADYAAVGESIVSVGDTVGGLRIESIALVRGQQIQSGSLGYRATIEISVSDSTLTNTTHIPAYVTMNRSSPTTIEDCSITRVNSENKTTEDLMCEYYRTFPTLYDPSNIYGCIERL